MHVIRSGFFDWAVPTTEFPYMEGYFGAIYRNEIPNIFIDSYSNLGYNIAVESPIHNTSYPRQYIPDVSGIETAQLFLSKINERHLLSGLSPWSLHTGGDGEYQYTPSAGPEFELTGYPLHDKNFWDRFKGNITSIGDGLLQNWTFSPWNNLGGKVLWSGFDYNVRYPYNVIPSSRLEHASGFLYYGRPNKEDYNQYLPVTSGSSPEFLFLLSIEEMRFAQNTYSPDNEQIVGTGECTIAGSPIQNVPESSNVLFYSCPNTTSLTKKNGSYTILRNEFYEHDNNIDLRSAADFVLFKTDDSFCQYDFWRYSLGNSDKVITSLMGNSPYGASYGHAILASSFPLYDQSFWETVYPSEVRGTAIGRFSFNRDFEADYTISPFANNYICDVREKVITGALTSYKNTPVYVYPTFKIENTGTKISNMRHVAGIISSGVYQYILNSIKSNTTTKTQWPTSTGSVDIEIICNNNPIDIYYSFCESTSDCVQQWVDKTCTYYGSVNLNVDASSINVPLSPLIIGHDGGPPCSIPASSIVLHYPSNNSTYLPSLISTVSGSEIFGDAPFNNLEKYKFLALFFDQKHIDSALVRDIYNFSLRSQNRIRKICTVIEDGIITDTGDSDRHWNHINLIDYLSDPCNFKCFESYYPFYYPKSLMDSPMQGYLCLTEISGNPNPYHLSLNDSYFEIEMPERIYHYESGYRPRHYRC